MKHTLTFLTACLLSSASLHAAPDILIADFEGDTYGDWKVEGEAFGKGPAHGKIGGQMPVTGFLGKGLVNSFNGGDGATGKLTSPAFKIERKFITFLIGGGGWENETCMNLLVDGKVVRTATGTNTKPGGSEALVPAGWDVAEFPGKQAVIQIVDSRKGGWGHINVDHIVQTDDRGAVALSNSARIGEQQPMAPKVGAMPRAAQPSVKDEAYALVQQSQTWDTFPLYAKVGYDQALRPQFHFTSRVGWLNDPNGMVYYDGEWLMAFQHCAKGNANGAKSWGQAVSKDLMHWIQLPHAINPYPNVLNPGGSAHGIWSGSAVVDELNVLGKQQGKVKTLFALFTATHQDEGQKKAAFFQAGAYSTDKGRIWTKINGGKPVIEHQEGYEPAQRDPYVFYHAPSKSYRCIMMIGGAERVVRIFKSTDLLHWEVLQDIPNKAAECINMFPVPLDGNPKNLKWMIADAGTHYEVGDFDGNKWTGLGAPAARRFQTMFDFGDSYYAAQVFNDAPDHRAVQIGWLKTKHDSDPFVEAGMPFTQQMSIPAELTLRTTPEGIRLFRNPVKEIASLYARTSKFDNLTVEAANTKLAMLSPELIDMTVAFVPAGDLTLNVRGLPIQYDSAKNEFTFTNAARAEKEAAASNKPFSEKPQRDNNAGRRTVPAPRVNGKVTLRVLVDRASLEFFVNDGQAAASFVVVPDSKNRGISITGASGVKIPSLEVSELKSAWEAQ